MKYLTIGIGIDRATAPNGQPVKRIQFDCGIQSTKPASEKLRKVVVITAAVIGLLLSFYGLQATDIPDLQPTYNMGALWNN